MQRSLTPLLALGLASLAPAQRELFEFHPAGPQVNVRFGESLDSEGDFLVVGCPWEKDGGVAAGVAYVYDFTSATELHRLVPSDGTKWDVFGHDVAIGGGLVVVGAHEHDAQGQGSGAAYVYDLASGIELAKLVAPNGKKDWRFGYGVDVDEDRIVVGAPMTSGAGDGRIYVFDASSLTLVQTLDPPANVPPNPGFGAAVAVDGERISAGSLNVGRAWVYDAITGAQLAEVWGNGGPSFGFYGRAVELDGDDLLVGARVDHCVESGAGAAYLHHWPTESLIYKSTPKDLGTDEYYGTSLELTPDWILVGAPRHNNDVVHHEGDFGNGAIWILDRVTGFEIKKVVASDGQELDFYGDAVTANDTHFAVGTSRDDDMLPNSGSVYLHLMPTRVGVSYCTPAVSNSTGAPATIEALGSATITDDTLVLVARQVPTTQFGMFLVSASAGNVPGAGGGQGTLCLGGTIARFRKQIMSSEALGALRAEVDLAHLPSPLGNAVLQGETWRFQAWYRDQNPGATSNFTDAVAVTFN